MQGNSKLCGEWEPRFGFKGRENKNFKDSVTKNSEGGWGI